MKLYLVKDKGFDIQYPWDTTDAIVVSAENEDNALAIARSDIDTWESRGNMLVCELLGVADASIQSERVILQSFNAG